MDSTGSSAHTHISVHSKHAVKTAEGLSPPESSFLSSVLTNLPALTALTMPIPASYRRMLDGIWSGGTYVNWGTENREAPIRLVNATSPSSRNFEIRCVDATANPYISLAGILGVGLDGIKRDVKLTIHDCPGPVTAAEMTEEGRRALGITSRMSLSWEESRSNLKANKLLTEHILGPELMEKYLNVHTVCILDGRGDSLRLILIL
jgi:glutamine synthetase